MRSGEEFDESLLFSVQSELIGVLKLSVEEKGRQSVGMVSMDAVVEANRELTPSANPIFVFFKWFIPVVEVGGGADFHPKVSAVRVDLGGVKCREVMSYVFGALG